jgi:hypothetical protein
VIDWWMVAAHSIWILGLSIVLAGCSYHEWVAAGTGRPRMDLFKQRSWQWTFRGGMALVWTGWSLASRAHWWAALACAAVAVAFLWGTGRLARAALRGR